MKKIDVCYKGGDDRIVAVIDSKEYTADGLLEEKIIGEDVYPDLHYYTSVLYDEDFKSEMGSLERQLSEGRIDFDSFMNAEEELFDSYIDRAVGKWVKILKECGHDAIDGGCI